MSATSSRPKPPKKNLARVGSQSFDTHVKRGHAILDLLDEQIQRLGKKIGPNIRVYDFACGIGRVAIPLTERYETQLYCSDVDHTAIDFLKSNYDSDLTAITTGYEPPLPFDDDFFDIIYSISLWSHLPAKLQISWLKEMRRIMNDDALLLITTAGTGTLGNWLKINDRTEPSVDELVSKGALFVKNQRLENDPNLFPGVSDDWGVFYQTTEYIQKNWSEIFTIESILDRHVGLQELVILRPK